MNHISRINKTDLYNWTLFFVSSIILISCDCDYDYEFVIENKTNSELKIYCDAGYLKEDSIHKTVFLMKDTSVIIYNVYNFWPGGGCPGPNKEDGKYLIDSINISINDSLVTKKNYKDYNNWTFTNTKRKGTFKISLTYNDFVLEK